MDHFDFIDEYTGLRCHVVRRRNKRGMNLGYFVRIPDEAVFDKDKIGQLPVEGRAAYYETIAGEDGHWIGVDCTHLYKRSNTMEELSVLLADELQSTARQVAALSKSEEAKLSSN